MGLTTKATASSEETKENNLWLTIPANSSVTIMPLVDCEGGIDKFSQFEFGQNKGFWTLPDTGELNDPCRLMGFTSKDKYIMPVLVRDSESGIWSEPMYYRFPKTVFDAFCAIDTIIKTTAESEDDKRLMFKHAVITIIRDDTQKNGFTKYSAQFTGQHLSRSKEYKSGKTPLPESNLNIIRGFLPFQIEGIETMTDEQIVEAVRPKIIERLIEKSDFEVTVNGTKTTIGELLKEKGLLSGEFDATDANFDEIDF